MAKHTMPLVAVAARGFAIGLADLVPGVSGGTIAFISGIYERLLQALTVSTSLPSLLLLGRGQIKTFWTVCDGTFLAVLACGVLAAVLTAAEGLRWLMINYTAVLLSFFCGLTLAGGVAIAARIRQRSWQTVLGFALGACATLLIVLFDPVSLQASPPASGFFMAGILAFAAMILPGISGSFLLLLIGIYPFVLEALHDRAIGLLAAFCAGGVIGLLGLARLLHRLLNSKHDITLAVLCGIMIGALPKLWPWRDQAEGISAFFQPAIVPWQAAEPYYLAAIGAFACGIAAVACLEVLARRAATKG